MSNAKKITNTKRPPSDFAKRIDHYIKQRGYTSISEFERKSGVPKDIVRRLIGGYAQKTTAENVAKIAKALGVQLSDLIGTASNIGMSSLNIAPDAINPKWEAVKSDEMHPTFHSGDFILVDAGIDCIQCSGIYAIKMSDSKITFRRIDLNSITGTIFVCSDNEKYRPEGDFKSQEVNIAGQVIGIFKAI